MNKCEGCHFEGISSWDPAEYPCSPDLVDKPCPCGNCLVKPCCGAICEEGLDWHGDAYKEIHGHNMTPEEVEAAEDKMYVESMAMQTQEGFEEMITGGGWTQDEIDFFTDEWNKEKERRIKKFLKTVAF